MQKTEETAKKISFRDLIGVQRKYEGTFIKLGNQQGWIKGKVNGVLLEDVADVESGKKIAGRLWVNYTKTFQKLELEYHEEGRIQFQATLDYHIDCMSGSSWCEHGEVTIRLLRISKIVWV